MRYFELVSGVRMPISKEEQGIVDRAEKGLTNNSMDERDQEVARLLVNRGVLNRKRNADKEMIFVPNNKPVKRD